MKNIALFILVVMLLAACSASKENIEMQLPEDPVSGPFSDCGAWFMIDNPDDGIPGIPAPLILSDSNGYYLPERLVTLEFPDATIQPDFTFIALTGRRIQEYSSDSLDVTLTYAYTDQHTLMAELEITNKGCYTKSVTLIHASALSTMDSSQRESNSTLHIQHDNQFDITENLATLNIPEQGQTTTAHFAVTHRFNDESEVTVNFDNATEDLIANKIRWINYFAPYSQHPEEEQLLAAKCIRTLISNWRTAQGALEYDGLFPSYAYRGFHGFWAWDSWKHAVALATFEPELAEDQIRTMFVYQNERGMIADCIFRDTLIERHNWRDTKPPLAAWAVDAIYKATNDTSFIREMMPKLEKYHQWWYNDRDQNGNGLCEYGSTDGTRIAAAWESGMDNAVRFDEATLFKNNDGAWSLDQESVDLNAYLFAEKEFLAEMALILGDSGKQQHYLSEATALKERIRERFYSEDQGYFFDYHITQEASVPVIGPAAWTTLWAGVATPEQAASVLSIIMDTLHFNTRVPFPTLSYSHPGFNPRKGYWRGPVWIDQAWFALEGMKRYGYHQEYEQMRSRLLHNAEGILEPGFPLRENYHPVTGEGLNAEHFSWTAAHLLLML